MLTFMQAYIMTPSNGEIRLQVLIDSVLNRNIGHSKQELGLQGEGQATFQDINGSLLQIPLGTTPFRRALYYMGYSAWQLALTSGRKLAAVLPSEEEWEKVGESCAADSDCEESMFFRHWRKERRKICTKRGVAGEKISDSAQRSSSSAILPAFNRAASIPSTAGVAVQDSSEQGTAFLIMQCLVVTITEDYCRQE